MTDVPPLCESFHFDKEGRPISIKEWGLLFEDTSYRRVAVTDIGRPSRRGRGRHGGHVQISTVWIGIDAGWAPPGVERRPIIFESMVFGGPLDGSQFRTRSREEAAQAHDALCRVARRARRDDLARRTHR